MRRPKDWHPLAERDPVPGDPGAIHREAKRLKNLAKTINHQVARLHAIGADHDRLKGKYADGLRTSAQDLAGKLSKTHHRYDHVGGYLHHWADELHHSQAEADQTLADAQDAQSRVDANKPPDVPHPHPGPAPDSNHPEHLTPEARAADEHRKRKLEGAQRDLEKAEAKLRKIISHRDDRARHWAIKINRAISKDGLHDKTWDKFKNWVDKNSRWLNDLANVLSWIATGLAVLALFIPGINLIVIAGLTAAVLALHTVLASTGNGNWADVALDIFALATMGTGKLASKGVEAAENNLRSTVHSNAWRFGKTAARDARATQADKIAKANRTLHNPTASKAAKAAARKRLADTDKIGRNAQRKIARKVQNFSRKEAKYDWRLNLKHGGDVGQYYSYKNMTKETFPNATRLKAAMNTHKLAINISRGSYLAGTGADVWDKLLGMTVPYATKQDDFWTHFKSRFTTPQGAF